MSLAVVIVAGSVVHAMLIEGTMETVSKAALCALVLAATIKSWRPAGVEKASDVARREHRATVNCAELMAINRAPGRHSSTIGHFPARVRPK